MAMSYKANLLVQNYFCRQFPELEERLRRYMSAEQMRNIPVDNMTPIYRHQCWERCRCQDLRSGVNWAAYDAWHWSCAANFLQKAVMVNQAVPSGRSH